MLPMVRTNSSKRSLILLSTFLALAVGLSLFALYTVFLGKQPPSPESRPGSAATLANLPLSFEPNAGQSDPAVQFLAHSEGNTLFFTGSGVVLALDSAPPEKKSPVTRTGSLPASRNSSKSGASVVRVEFLGANPSTAVRGNDLLPGRTNYIRGKDRRQWHTDLPTYAGILYPDLYDGVDLAYKGDSGQLKGTYLVAPGSDPGAIRWRYAGARSVSVDPNANLLVSLPSGLDGESTTLTESAPVAWQHINGKQVLVAARYKIGPDESISLELGAYDHTRPLTIDPVIVYSTYLGGFYGDGAGSIHLDSAGNIYIGGTTASSDFPLAGDPYQPVYGGGNYDMFASKISPDGSTLIYSTFVGGGDWDEGGLAGVDATGIATLGGWTASDDFPTTPGAYQTQFAGTEDVAVARLSADGSDLIFGSYWGDEGVDESYGFAVDGSGNTYFTGYYFPDLNSWAFVAALSSDGSQQLFRHNLGGEVPGPGDENANTSGEGIVVDEAGNIYVTGYTRAADFPVTQGAYRTSIEAYEDGFVTKLSPLGRSILYSTYIPGNISDYPSDIAIDQSGSAYITGNTLSSDYPTTPGAFRGSCGDSICAFLSKLNPTGSDLVFSSYLGGIDLNFDAEDYGLVVRVSRSGSAYVGGYTSSPSFPVVNAIQSALRGPSDGFLIKFTTDGTGAEYSTYLGGSAGDSIGGITLDNLGHVYLAGSSSSSDFPMVNPLQPTNHGSSDAIIAVIAEDGAATFTPSPTHVASTPSVTGTPGPCGVTSWSTETPMEYPRARSAAAVVNGQLYVVGGDSNPPTPGPYAAEKFDPATQTWESLPASPYLVVFRQAASIGSQVYVIGNTYDPAASFLLAYDTVSNSWTRRADLPDAFLNGAMTAYDGEIYIFGGQAANEYPSDRTFEYDPATNIVTEKAPMPSGQAEIGAAAVGNRIYVAGGYQYIHYVYDPATDSWSSIAAPLTPTFSFPAVFAFGDEVWVIGGYDNWTERGYPPDQEVQIYNPVTNSWRYGPVLNQPRYYSTAAGVIGGRAYLVGGVDLNSISYPYDYLTGMESITYLPCPTTTPVTPTEVSTTVPSTTPAHASSTPTSSGQPSATPSVQGQPSHTASPQIPTASPTPLNPTPTPTTATPTACSISFGDIPPGSTFYQYIMCMACQGIISGYSDGTFRPGNDVTRGQLSKIVSNSAGFVEDIPASRQTFTDVPRSNPFWLWIERIAGRGIITGYTCGGPNEPCDGQNRPYFRWGADATRGQISKIVSEAKGMDDPVPPDQQTFTDVPRSNPFWLWIERLAERGIMVGYRCGGPGEPCDPQGRAYFRPGNNATRGQTAKIVSNTFFPDCMGSERR